MPDCNCADWFILPHQASDEKQRLMQQRLERTEQRQAQMMQFLSKALQHPEMLQSLVGARQQRFDGSNVQGALPPYCCLVRAVMCAAFEHP